MVANSGAGGDVGFWVLLSYRVPREPSTPRIAIWRKLKKLGVAQVGDGLVALPADARTQEQLEWVAEQIAEVGGSSTMWRAQLTSRADERGIVTTLQQARAAEYAALISRVTGLHDLIGIEFSRAVRSVRRELREIQRRDYFPPPQRHAARQAVEALAVTETSDERVGAQG